MLENNQKVVVIAGAGLGNGAAFARRFITAGQKVIMLCRSAANLERLNSLIPGSEGYVCDLTDEKAVISVFQAIKNKYGSVTTLIYNAGSGVFNNIENITPSQFEDAWRVNALGSLLCAQAVIADMKQSQKGNIIFIGATASIRGGATFAGFAPAKAAQRSLAESMARHLWPSGIHVSMVIIDGFIDQESARKKLPNKPQSFFLKPDKIAETVFNVTEQDKSAWSFEVNLRPFGERW